MVEIGQDVVSEQLDIVPMQVRVLRHIRKRYGCPKGDQGPVTAPVPAQVLPAGKRGRAHEALALIGKLYAIERDARELSDLERLA